MKSFKEIETYTKTFFRLCSPKLIIDQDRHGPTSVAKIQGSNAFDSLNSLVSKFAGTRSAIENKFSRGVRRWRI